MSVLSFDQQGGGLKWFRFLHASILEYFCRPISFLEHFFIFVQPKVKSDKRHTKKCHKLYKCHPYHNISSRTKFDFRLDDGHSWSWMEEMIQINKPRFQSLTCSMRLPSSINFDTLLPRRLQFFTKDPRRYFYRGIKNIEVDGTSGFKCRCRGEPHSLLSKSFFDHWLKKGKERDWIFFFSNGCRARLLTCVPSIVNHPWLVAIWSKWVARGVDLVITISIS